MFTFTRVAAHFYPLYVYLPGSLQILSGNQPYLHVYALASDIHLSIAFLAAFFVLESLGGNTIKIILEDDRS